MAQRFYDIDLDNSAFPMLSEQQARTIIGSTAGEAPSRDGRPHVSYCHNVMPSKYGLDSVGFLNVIPSASAILPNSSLGITFSDERTVYGDAKSRMSLAWDTQGNVYALRSGTTAWIAIPATVPTTVRSNFSIDSVTIGRVNGISYIFYSKIGAFTYNEITNSLDAVTLPGLNISEVLGVTASSGYLIAYTDEAIAWSSTILPTDFVPSQVTGAGGGNVAGIGGSILFATSNSLGIIVYTSSNAIAATYTGNARFPFKFREVVNSKGGINLDRVAYENNSSIQYVYSKAGLQAVTSQKAEIILPEVTDFLAGKRFEDFDEVSRSFILTNLSSGQTMKKKVKFIASRYLVVSYGLPGTGTSTTPSTDFTHAIIFDTALNKLGKIKKSHVDVFEYVGFQAEVSKESIAFIDSTGKVDVIDFSTTALSTGVLILGKLQFVRTRFISLLGVEVENIPTGALLDVYTRASLNGKTISSTVLGFLRVEEDNIREYGFRVSAKNHSLLLIGKFNATTIQIRYATLGRR